MNILEFISKIIGEISWPITVVVLVIILRKNIAELLTSLTKLKFKDLEMDFQRLAESAAKLPPAQPPPPDEKPVSRAIYASFEDQIFDVVERAPSAAILLAWASVETSMSSAVAGMAISAEPPQYRSPVHNLEQLQKYTELSQEVAHTINEMRMLRNKVAHDEKQRIRISQDSALSYAETAIRITKYLNGLKK